MQGNLGVRFAKHAGSWYEKQKKKLLSTIDEYLKQAELSLKFKAIKAIIAPHAGYAYSGPTAGWAYRYLQAQLQKNNAQSTRIFLLGPSHKKYIEGCSISTLSELETPLGNLKIDREEIQVLQSKAKFKHLSKREQENEHSLEMHMPFLYRIFGETAKVIPIIVGDNNEKMLQEYGKAFSQYLTDPNTIFIISSDFCHWGQHFDYQPHSPNKQIYKHIEELDRQGMNLIQANNLKGFKQYINNTGNTICGEQPIRLLMSAIRESQATLITKFVRYQQSEKVTDFESSSVSYASGVCYFGE